MIQNNLETMAGPIISAFGKRSLFATFLTPKTFLFRPFIVSPILLQVRHSSACLAEAASNRTVGPRQVEPFRAQLRRAGVELATTTEQHLLSRAAVDLKVAIGKAIKSVPSATSDDAFHVGSIDRLKSENALLHAIVPILFPDANKSKRFQTGVDELWKDQLPLCPELSGCRKDSRQLTQAKPDRCTGFILQPWETKYQLATATMKDMMSPTEGAAFHFFNVEGKGKKGEEEVAVNQILNSMPLALRNLAFLHDKVMGIADRELDEGPGHHVSTYLSSYPSVQTYNLNASVHLIGASDESVTIPGTTTGSIVSQLAPYTNFNDNVIVLSAMILLSKVHLNCHWRSSTSLPARNGIKQITNGPSYHHHRLMSWNIEDGLEQAKVAIDAAIEHVANALEGRLNTYMRILEDHLRRSNGAKMVEKPGLVRRDDLVWM